jgi:hypothetical protein
MLCPYSPLVSPYAGLAANVSSIYTAFDRLSLEKEMMTKFLEGFSLDDDDDPKGGATDTDRGDASDDRLAKVAAAAANAEAAWNGASAAFVQERGSNSDTEEGAGMATEEEVSYSPCTALPMHSTTLSIRYRTHHALHSLCTPLLYPQGTGCGP